MMSVECDERGRSVFETLLVLALIGAAVVLAIDRFSSSSRDLKEQALAIELASLRKAVVSYAMFEKKMPSSLIEITSDNIEIPAEGMQGERRIVIVGRFVETALRDSEGNPLDPFGNRYGYDPSTGRVWSTTKDYQDW